MRPPPTIDAAAMLSAPLDLLRSPGLTLAAFELTLAGVDATLDTPALPKATKPRAVPGAMTA